MHPTLKLLMTVRASRTPASWLHFAQLPKGSTHGLLWSATRRTCLATASRLVPSLGEPAACFSAPHGSPVGATWRNVWNLLACARERGERHKFLR